MAWPCKSLLERWHAFAVETPSKHGPAACSNLPSQSTSALSFLKCDKRPPSWGGRCAWLSSSSTVDRDSIRRRARNNVARNNLARNKHRRRQHRGQQHRRSRTKGGGQGECEPAKHASDTVPKMRVTGAGAHTASSPSLTQGGSRVREFCTHGSGRGAVSNDRPYRTSY